MEKRIAVLEYQNKALREQIKKLMQLYEQDLLNATLIKLINFEQTIIVHSDSQDAIKEINLN